MKRISFIIGLMLLLTTQAFAIEYKANPACADQAATTCVRSIKNLVTAIGTTKTATIVLDHTSSGLTTTYTLGQALDTSTYTNITLKPAWGARLNRGTYAFNWGGKLDVLPGQQWLEGTGAVTLSGSVPVLYPEWWGGKGDASTDNYAAIQQALNNLIDGRKVVINDGTWNFGTGLVWTGYSNTTLECNGLLSYTGATGTALTIGGATEYGNYKGNIRLRHGKTTAATWSDGVVGVNTINIFESSLTFDNIGRYGTGTYGFAVGLKVSGTNANGNAYNSYYLNRFVSNQIGVLIENNTSGWATQNEFYGGRFDNIGTHTDAEWAASYHIYVTTGNNNNTFYSPSFENDDYYCWFYNNSSDVSLIFPRLEGSPDYKVINDVLGYKFTLMPGYMTGVHANANNEIVDLNGTMKFVDRYSSSFGYVNKFTSIAADTVTALTYRRGDILHKYVPVYGTWALKVCTQSGTYSDATDSTGDTDGSTAVITGLTDTSDFYLGQYVTVSAGFPSATLPYQIIAITSTTITLDTNSNSAQSDVTVATPDPLWMNIARTQSDDMVQSVTYGATVTPDLSLGHVVSVGVLTGDVKIENPTKTFAGQRFSVRLVADGTGRNITYGTNFKAATAALTASKRIILDFMVVATNQIVQINTPIECD